MYFEENKDWMYRRYWGDEGFLHTWWGQRPLRGTLWHWAEEIESVATLSVSHAHIWHWDNNKIKSNPWLDTKISSHDTANVSQKSGSREKPGTIKNILWATWTMSYLILWFGQTKNAQSSTAGIKLICLIKKFRFYSTFLLINPLFPLDNLYYWHKLGFYHLFPA